MAGRQKARLKVWTVELEGGEHVVELDHNVSPVATLHVDGKMLRRDWSLIEAGRQYAFEIAGHPCRLVVSSDFIFRYELFVDGESLGPPRLMRKRGEVAPASAPEGRGDETAPAE